MARKIFHGQRGELRQRYPQGQEDQLGALALVHAAVVLWNIRPTDAALTALRDRAPGSARPTPARLSPLADAAAMPERLIGYGPNGRDRPLAESL